MSDQHDDPIDRLTESVEQLVDQLREQTSAVEAATAASTAATRIATDAVRAMSHHLRLTRVANAALTVGLLSMVVVAGVWAADYRSAERAQCRSSNETRTAVIDASSTAVLVASMEFADDEAERVEARRIAGVTAEALAARPGLRLRDC